MFKMGKTIKEKINSETQRRSATNQILWRKNMKKKNRCCIEIYTT